MLSLQWFAQGHLSRGIEVERALDIHIHFEFVGLICLVFVFLKKLIIVFNGLKMAVQKIL